MAQGTGPDPALEGRREAAPDPRRDHQRDRDDETVVLDMMLRSHGIRLARGPSTVGSFVFDLGRLAGFAISRRQPLSGVRKVLQGNVKQQTTLRLHKQTKAKSQRLTQWERELTTRERKLEKLERQKN
ncbi:MAG: hypothetical protein OXB95_11410 [Rhodobacteraceae bacterium]|nr:hypothetical protein [Paracoccaceae bacterium]